MQEYLRDNHGHRPAYNVNMRMELEFLREQCARLSQPGAASQGESSTADEGAASASSEDSEGEEDVFELPLEEIKKKNQGKGPRASVSAEAFGNWNKKEEFKAPVHEKSAEMTAALRSRLSSAFMFGNLNPAELEIVIGAMQKVSFAQGQQVIRQGDNGDNLYVVETGKLKCSKVFNEGEEATYLKDYVPGEAFGELALLYNAPRAASIEAIEASECWSLDRRTFNHIVKDSAQEKREKYEAFLTQVSILQNMESYERSKLADAIREKWYEEGEYVITEGQEGEVFYLIMSGRARATKTLEPGKAPVEVMAYKEGDYFGERALLKNEPRAANVIATTRLQVVALDRGSFRRLLGPIDQILMRNMENYQKFITAQ